MSVNIDQAKKASVAPIIGNKSKEIEKIENDLRTYRKDLERWTLKYDVLAQNQAAYDSGLQDLLAIKSQLTDPDAISDIEAVINRYKEYCDISYCSHRIAVLQGHIQFSENKISKYQSEIDRLKGIFNIA